MLVHRKNTVLKSTNSSPEWASSYTVAVTPVGAVVASAITSNAVIPLESLGSFRIGDKFLRNPGSDNEYSIVAITALDTSAKTITMGATQFTMAAGDKLVNLGADTEGSATTPNYDEIRVGIFSDSDGGTRIDDPIITCDSEGEYEYWHRGDGRFWEVIRDSTGTPQDVICGWGGQVGRYNVADYGAVIDGTTDDIKACQAACDEADTVAGGEVFFPQGVTVIETGLTFRWYVSLRGTGPASIIKTNSAINMITTDRTRSNTLVVNHSAYIKDLSLDGQDTATRGIELGFQDGGQCENIEVRDVNGWGIAFNGTQNFTADNLRVMGGKHGFAVTHGTSHSTFTMLRTSALTGVNIYIGAHGDFTGDASRPWDYSKECNFIGCLFETLGSPNTETSHHQLDQGIDNQFIGCYFGVNDNGASATSVFNLSAGATANRNKFINCRFDKQADDDFPCVLNRQSGTVLENCKFGGIGGSFPECVDSDQKCIVWNPHPDYVAGALTEGGASADLQTMWVDMTDATKGMALFNLPLIIADGYGGLLRHAVMSEEITLDTGALFTNSTAFLIPAPCIVDAVVWRVTETITTATNYDVGTTVQPTAFTTDSTDITVGDTGIGLDHFNGAIAAADTDGFTTFTTSVKIRITCDANPGAGKIRVTVFYRQLTAPTG